MVLRRARCAFAASPPTFTSLNITWRGASGATRLQTPHLWLPPNSLVFPSPPSTPYTLTHFEHHTSTHRDGLRTELKLLREDIHRITLELKERAIKVRRALSLAQHSSIVA